MIKKRDIPPKDEIGRLIDDVAARVGPGRGVEKLLGRLREAWQALQARQQEHQAQAHQISAALCRRECEFRALIEGSPDPILRFDRQLRLIYANAAAEQGLGMTRPRMLGRPLEEMGLGKELYQLWQEKLAEVMEQEQAISFEFVQDSALGPRFFRMRLVPEPAANGAVESALGIVRDISERKQAERDLLEAKEAAEAANRAKDHFLAVLSHELRTPLTPALTVVQMLECAEHLPAEVLESIAMVRRNIQLEIHLIDDLLDLTRISRGKLELRLAPTDVHVKLRQVLEILDGDIKAKKLRLLVRLEAWRPWVQADAPRLQQVFWNLIKNAIKFTPEGGAITVRTWNGEGARNEDKATRGPGDKETDSAALPIENRKSKIENPPDSALSTPHSALLIEISDTGVGIDPKALPRIFDAFEQGGRSVTRLFGGLGLGLTITKGLVDLHGGDLTAQSPGRGCGASFRIQLPSIEPGALPVSNGLVFAQRPGKMCRILLVEDHADTAMVMARLLEGQGFVVRTAGGVAAALQAARAEPFDLLISDIGLPDGTGYDLMRQLTVRGPIKGIAVSGFGMEQDIDRSRQAGFVEHLIKPVSIRHLEEAIRRVTEEGDI